MAIADEIQALETYLGNAYSKCADKGATIPQNRNMQNLTACIDSIQGGGSVIPPDAGTLTGIAFQSLPNKITYTEGEALDLTGCVVLGSYSNGGYYDVTANCTFIADDPVSYYNPVIQVTLDTFSLTINLTVNASPVPAPSGTLQLYHFDNNAVEEVSGNSPTLTNVAYETGKFGYAIRQSNADAKQLYVVNIDDNVINDGLTIEFWTKESSRNTEVSLNLGYLWYTSSSSWGPIFSSDNISTTGLKARTSGYNWTFASDCYVDNIPSNFNIKAWHHVAIVIKRGTYQMYLDGVKACHGTRRTGSLYCLGFYCNNQQSYSYERFTDELLITTGEKYLDTFVPNHAPYYLQSNS